MQEWNNFRPKKLFYKMSVCQDFLSWRKLAEKEFGRNFLTYKIRKNWKYSIVLSQIYDSQVWEAKIIGKSFNVFFII